MAFTPAPVRDPFDKDLRASRSWVAWFAEVQQTIANIVAGSVTSVGLALPSQFTVSGSPVTGSGTLTGAWKNQSANTFLGGPTTGLASTPDFRALTTADIPALAYDPVGAAAAVQTNLNTHTGSTGTSVHGLGDWSVKNYPTWVSGTPFVKMTAAGTFGLDTSTYLTSLTGAVLTDQTFGQTIGVTAHRLTKLWATDIDVTNAITGSVTGNAGTVTNGLYTTGLGSVTQAYSAKLAGLAGLTDAAGWYHSNGSGTYAWSTPTKSDVGLGSVENTALSTWAGTSHITILGIIATGTWAAGVIGAISSSASQGVFSGWASLSGASAYSGQITLGNTASAHGQIQMGIVGSNLDLTIDNEYDHATLSRINFRTRTSGTPVNALTLVSTKATFPGTLTVGAGDMTYGASDSGGTGYKLVRVPN